MTLRPLLGAATWLREVPGTWIRTTGNPVTRALEDPPQSVTPGKHIPLAPLTLHGALSASAEAVEYREREKERATTHRGLSSPALVRVNTAFTLGSRSSSSLEAAPAYVYFASPVGGTASKRVRCGACPLRRRGSQVLLRRVFLLLIEGSGVGTCSLLRIL